VHLIDSCWCQPSRTCFWLIPWFIDTTSTDWYRMMNDHIVGEDWACLWTWVGGIATIPKLLCEESHQRGDENCWPCTDKHLSIFLLFIRSTKFWRVKPSVGESKLNSPKFSTTNVSHFTVTILFVWWFNKLGLPFSKDFSVLLFFSCSLLAWSLTTDSLSSDSSLPSSFSCSTVQASKDPLRQKYNAFHRANYNKTYLQKPIYPSIFSYLTKLQNKNLQHTNLLVCLCAS